MNPITYRTDYEHLEENEAETTRELEKTLLDIATKVADDEGHAYRAVHAKGHGLLEGEFEAAAAVPEPYAQGIAKLSGAVPVVMRFSTPPGDLLDDGVSTPRGVALKLLAPQGEQDFVMIDGPAFNAKTAKQFLGSLKLLAATTDKAPGLKKALSAALRGLEAGIEKVGGESATIKAMGGMPATHLLGDTFFTQVPLLWGPYMAKVSLAPESPSLRALTDAKLTSVGDRPDALREEVQAFFAAQPAHWALRVQLCTDLEKMPIEDPTVPWPEDLSPWVTVGRIAVPVQDTWSADKVRRIDDGMSFNPWHAWAEHRPLGAIMRVRKSVYEAAATFRLSRNGCPMHAAAPTL